MLGLPAIIDHLFDVSPLPAVARGHRRLLRPGRSPSAADGQGAQGLLDPGRRSAGRSPAAIGRGRLDPPRHALRRRRGL